ncbi:MAG: prolipoprotein diacylglyceryl transferase [Oscillospiraceae bacterium]|nr:prolipoprotein diacylglyceryl transferase [Oscillospiraceae bacterium]
MNTIPISFPMFGEDAIINPSTHFTVFGKNIYWYGVLIAVGFILAVLYAMKRSKEFGLTQDNILDCLIVATPAGIIGARLYYVIFNPADYFGPGKWGNIVKIWEGGLAIYGGIIATVLAVFLVCRKKKISMLSMMDVVSLGFLIGQCIGRWGNFFNREAYGAETDVFCRMGLHYSSGTVYVHPTFLYESLWNLIGFVILHFVSKKHRRFKGQIFISYLGWYGLGRYFIESLRTDSLYLGSTDIRVSQLLAAVCFGASVIFLIAALRRVPGKLALASAQESASDGESGEEKPVPFPAGGPDQDHEITADTAEQADTDISEETVRTDKEVDNCGHEETGSE